MTQDETARNELYLDELNDTDTDDEDPEFVAEINRRVNRFAVVPTR